LKESLNRNDDLIRYVTIQHNHNTIPSLLSFTTRHKTTRINPKATIPCLATTRALAPPTPALDVAPSPPKPSTTSSVGPTAPLVVQLRQPRPRTSVVACQSRPSACPAHPPLCRHPSPPSVDEAASPRLAPTRLTSLQLMMMTALALANPPPHTRAACHLEHKHSEPCEEMLAQVHPVKAVASTGLSSLDPEPKAPSRRATALPSRPSRRTPSRFKPMSELRVSARCRLLLPLSQPRPPNHLESQMLFKSESSREISTWIKT